MIFPYSRAARILALTLALGTYPGSDVLADDEPTILTPMAAATPRINGPSVFGVRPNAPFRYMIPVTGERPMEFKVNGLPAGLTDNEATGQITGAMAQAGAVGVEFEVRNAKGTARKKFKIVVGDKIALTPAMGWNSWNCWAASVSQEKVLRSARAMTSSGLINHGWTYINIDDNWQGRRGGKDNALQSNEKFPNMRQLCDEIHALGLKAGIYSTPWVTSYGNGPGVTSDKADGTWTEALLDDAGHHLGKFSFAAQDAKQWADWGFDYLKYDWRPNDVAHTEEMAMALRASGRDIVFSLSNTAPFEHAEDWARLANSWRTTDDIWDRWASGETIPYNGVSEIGFNQERWAPSAGPGHWNDPDMLVIGYVGWGPNLHHTHLTPDEQYAHISLWCLLSAPLLIGCDLERLDAFTLNLLSNDEVLALDQDALGQQAVRVASVGPVDIYLKPLEDGGKAVGFFNRDSARQDFVFRKLTVLGINTGQHVRDLWRQKDLPDVTDPAKELLSMTLPAHGVMLYRLTPIDRSAGDAADPRP